MDKEWIIDKLLHAGTEVTDESNDECDAVWLTIPRASVDDVAEAIAQAHEQELRNAQLAIMPCGHHASNVVGADEGTAYCEMCELEGQIEESQGHVRMASKVNANLAREIPKLQGQVAVMAGALRHIKDEWFDKWYPADIFVGGPVSDEGVNDVVAIREMIVQALESAPEVLQLDEVEFVASERRGWPALYMYALGNEADGYVEKGEYRGELMGYPETLLETSEAILIILAKPECSANQASGPKSEQELGDE